MSKSKKLSDFRQQAMNANKHTERGMKALEASMNEVGYTAPMIAAADGEIIAGSARHETAASVFGADVEPVIIESDGKRPIVVVRTDIKNAETRAAKRIGLLDNRVQEIDLSFDPLVLAQLYAEDKTLTAGLWSDDELTELLNEGVVAGDADAEPQIDKAAELNKVWQVKTGDMWHIGDHRLLCGDSTKREDVERVMGGEKANSCVSDSPYGINREGIKNDDPEGLQKLFEGILAVLPIENGVIVNFQSPRLFPVWLDAVKKSGHKFERALWMHKINDVTNAWRQWMMNGEIIIISSIGLAKWGNPSPPTQDCYVVKHDTKVNIAHASVKPLQVVQDVVNHVVGIVYEPFAGSGTTLVACQNLSRKCRGIEISPDYCAVILQRMKDAFPNIEIKRHE